MWFKNPVWQVAFLIVLPLVTGALALFSIISPSPLAQSTNALKLGQVASQDILAPRSLSYDSQVLTDQQREFAVRAVSPVYTPLDTSVARRQVSRLRDTLAYISSVRTDQYADLKQKQEDLSALEDFQFQPDTDQKLLALSDNRWQLVQQEAINVLEQVMRTTIREGQLEDVRRSVPAMISLSIPDDQAALVVELVRAFVSPNSVFSEALTETARQQARDSIKPIKRSFVQGETVVSRGRLISELDMEALQKLGLAQPQKTWQDYVGVAIMVLIMLVFLALYLRSVFVVRYPRVLGRRALVVLAGLFLTFLYLARLIVPTDDLIPFMVPLSAYSLTLAALFGSDLAFISILPLVLLSTYGVPNPLELILYHVIGTMFGVFSLGRAQRLFSFLGASAVSAFSGALIVLTYRFLETPITGDLFTNIAFQRMVLVMLLVAAANSISSAGLTIVLQFFLAQFLGVVSPLHLVELTRPDHPLLRLLMRSAPGSYQHSLQVANLAEQAADSVNANGLLARVGALYHDVGKTNNPAYFIENQVPGQPNPHDNLDPADSAAIIIAHVPDGMKLAQKYRLPRRVQSFITEHHGDMLARYQYINAIKAAGGDESLVEEGRFRYPGHRPQTRETGIVMLADGCEAASRAKRPSDLVELRKIVDSIFEARLKDRMLEETDLSLKDLAIIKESFIETLKGIYHPRIEYPKLEHLAELPSSQEDTQKTPRRDLLPEPAIPITSPKDVEALR